MTKLILLAFVGLAMIAASSLRAMDPIKPAAGNPVVVLDTSMGKIKLELFQDKAPITVKNFLKYVEDGHYDGTVFHRVMGKENTDNMEDFMIQGGGFDKSMNQKKTREPIKNESGNGLKNEKYTVAMARLGRAVGGVPAEDSATSQFFINSKDNGFLDKAQSRDGHGYCVFARVIDGFDVCDKIKAVKTGIDRSTGMPNVPETPVEIKSAKVEK